MAASSSETDLVSNNLGGDDDVPDDDDDVSQRVDAVLELNLCNSSRKNYTHAYEDFIGWLAQQQKYSGMTMTSTDGKRVLTNEYKAIALCDYLEKKRTKDGGTLSYSGLNRYRSAVNHFMGIQGVHYSDSCATLLTKFFMGIKRREARERHTGERSMNEGKSELPFQLYVWLCEYFLMKGNLFAHSYLILSWNLCCRTNNTEAIVMRNIEWSGDALRIYFGITKSDQEGDRKDPRHIFANPDCPQICPVLSLAMLLADRSNVYCPTDRLFFGGSQSSTFSKALDDALSSEEGEKMLIHHGVNRKDIGTHSVRKGVGTLLGTGILDGPSASAICNRMNWAQGNVQSRYLKYGARGDAFAGRCVAGLDPDSFRFSILPPHFLTPISPNISKCAFPCTKELDYLEQVRQFCLASLVQHKDFIREKLKSTHRLLQSFVFRSDISDIQGQLSSDLFNCENHFRPSGVPRTVRTLYNDQQLAQKMEQLPERLSTMMEEIIERNGIRSGNITYDTMMKGVKELLESHMPNDKGKEKETSERTPVEAVMHYWGSGFHRVPEDFKFPQVTVKGLWMLWWEGNVAQKISPYRFLTSDDVAKPERRKLSDIRCVAKYLVKKCTETRGVTLQEIATYDTQTLCDAFHEIADSMPRCDKKRTVRWSEWQYTTALREMRQGEGATHQIERGVRKRKKPGTPAVRRGTRKRRRKNRD